MNRLTVIVLGLPLAALASSCTGAGGNEAAVSNSDGGTGESPSTDTGGAETVAVVAACPANGPYEPVAVGNKWTYKATDHKISGVTTVDMKTVEIVGMEAVPAYFPEHKGKAALRFETKKNSTTLMDGTVSWRYRDGARLLRYAEESFLGHVGHWKERDYWTPARLRFDESMTAAGISWNETYREYSEKSGAGAMAGGSIATDSTDRWMVVSVDKPCPIMVKGAALTCIELKKADDAKSADAGKTYWFARCVGKVMEIGRPPNPQTMPPLEELVDYTVSW